MDKEYLDHSEKNLSLMKRFLIKIRRVTYLNFFQKWIIYQKICVHSFKINSLSNYLLKFVCPFCGSLKFIYLSILR